MPNPVQPQKLWTKSFISLTICSLLLFLNLQMMLSSFPAYVKNEFHVGDLSVSLVTSVFAITAILSRFLSAVLMRRIHRNVILFAGLAIASVMTGITIWAGSIGSMLVMRVGFGIGFGIVSTIIPTLVSQIIPSKRIGEGIGYFGLSTSLAMSIGPMIGLNVMKHYGFSMLAVISTAAIILIFPIILLSRAIPPAPSTNRATGEGSQSKPAFNTKLLFPSLLNVILAVTYSGLLSFIALYGEMRHLDQVGLFFLFNAFTIILIRPISGKVFDRKGPAAVLIPAATSVVASLTVLSYTTSMSMLIVSALLYGLGFGAIQPTLQAWMLRSSTKEQYGMANSMFYNTTDFGIAIGALILGAISSMSDYAIMYRYSAGFMILFLIVYVVVQWVSATKRTQPAVTK
ncbi:MFS transporter [Paenibacillus periandrae]|uniref:MFS transporter n=1 Tax=Paenibacillus periandrae TaxID=1761741 RepID=UPI001F08988C|nr:MFS transporter [Paenibacillus periandrae]